MKYVIKQSKTVDDAVKDALLELDVTEDDVEIEVIEEASKGLFGIIGTKEAKVKVTLVYDPINHAREFIDKILVSMTIKGDVDIRKEEDVLYVDITGVDPDDKGIIIGKRGNTLDSIQYLLSLAINRNRDKYTRISLDIEDYRKRREETLIRLAEKMADKAKYTNRPVKLEPMNPSERRIIHSALQKYNGVTTYSEGNEPFRRVVIQAK
ncbi:MAG TPA: RNA-binding cell elongation regulator Jag/EloR [Tissierellaceae bacterium]|nr:RNA-binding cell elongation regulator Jag/EloR [Tissierellaceae bacterium]